MNTRRTGIQKHAVSLVRLIAICVPLLTTEISNAQYVNPANQHSYFLTPALMTWTDAEAYAMSIGGHLVTINDASEDSWIFDTIVNDGTPIWIWTGLNDLTTEGVWEWVSEESVIYTNWGIGEPNNGNGGPAENACQIVPVFDFPPLVPGDWNDAMVGDMNAFGLVELDIAVTKVWDGGAGTTSWHDAANWNPDGVPGPADDVLIDVPGNITVVHSSGTTTINSLQCDEALTISNFSTLNLNALSDLNGPVNIATANLVIHNSGTVHIADSLTWSGGTIGFDGTITFGSLSTLNITSSTQKNIGAPFEIHGTAVYSGSNLLITASGIINNHIGAEFTASGVSNFSSSGSFNNFGTFIRDGLGNTTFNAAFNNMGTVNLLQGSLRLLGGGTHSGDFNINSSTIGIDIGGNHSFDPDSSISGDGFFQVSGFGGVSTIACDINIGDLSFFAGTTTFNAPVTASTWFIAGGTATFNAATTLGSNTPSWAFSSGTLGGSGEVTITGAVQWTGGTMSGTGATILATGASASLTGSSKTLGRPFVVSGECTWSAGTLNLSSTGELLVDEDGMFVASGSSQLNALGAGVVQNDGLFKQIGPAVSNFENTGGFNNNGTLEVTTGQLWLSRGGTHTGNATIALGAGLAHDFLHTYQPESSISGTGTVFLNYGTTFLHGTVECGLLSLGSNGGTNTFNGAVSVQSINLTGGTTTFNNVVTVSDSVSNTGMLVLDSSAQLQIGGDYTQGVAGTIHFDAAPNSQSPVIACNSASLDGDLTATMTPATSSATSLVLIQAGAGGSASNTFASTDLAPNNSVLANESLPTPRIVWNMNAIADLSGDDMVNVTDLFMLLAAWGNCPLNGPCPADLAPAPQGDGVVDVNDLFYLLANWGP